MYQSLAIVRSLGAAGFKTIAGCHGRRHAAAYSRFCGSLWQHPPMQDEQAFISALQSFLRSRNDICALYPGGEFSAALLRRHEQALGVPVVAVDNILFAACQDKIAANRLALDAGLRVPQAGLADSPESLRALCEEIGYPVIIKPYQTKLALLGRKVVVVGSSAELAARLAVWPAEHARLMAQQFVAGSLEGADFVAHQGRLVAYCEATTERTDTLDGTGFGVEFKSILPTADVFAATRKFAATHSYNGPGLIQFLRADADGAIYFVENNPRLSAGVATSVNWGQDIPLLALYAACPQLADEPLRDYQPHEPGARLNTTIYWFERDLEAYLRQRTKLSKAQKAHWRRRMLSSWRRAFRHVGWRRDDPLPTAYVYSRMFYRVLRGNL